MYDLIIKNATVIDGTGAEPFRSDVAVSGGKIAAIGSLQDTARETIDAAGSVLTPGFIDSHSHGDNSIFNPHHPENPEQGITFSIGGQCGSSVAPSTRDGALYTMGDLAKDMKGVPISSHYAILAGHGTIRRLVVGTENRPVTEKELSQMCRLLEESMDAGGMGLSLGLTYTPGSYADREELIALAKVVGRKGGILASHIRNESDELIPSVEEFIAICREGGCRGVISHLKAADRKNHGKVKIVLSMMEQAQKEGVEIFADAYPYCASATSLSSRFIPRQFHPIGTTDPIALLSDPAIRSAIKTWATEKWGTDLSWVLVTGCAGHPEYRGKTMNEVAEAMGMEDRYEAVFRLLQEGHRVNCCFTMMTEADVATVLAHPLVMVGCDSTTGNGASTFHPRRRTSFPRILGKYVREEKITTLPEMIRKMTGLPALVYGLPGKGRIAPGYDADICIFDPDTIRETADYVDVHAPNIGIHYVLIDGKIVVKDGKYNGTLAAKLFLR